MPIKNTTSSKHESITTRVDVQSSKVANTASTSISESFERNPTTTRVDVQTSEAVITVPPEHEPKATEDDDVDKTMSEVAEKVSTVTKCCLIEEDERSGMFPQGVVEITRGKGNLRRSS